MDAIPPSSPPAIVYSEDGHATDTLRDLAAIRDALIRQQAALPSPRLAVERGSRQAFLDALATFWQGHDKNDTSGTRLAGLGAYVALALRDMAILRGLDGSLEARAVTLARRAAEPTDHPTIEHHALTMGGVDYAGALIVTDTAQPDLALLFTHDGGIETFAGLDELHATVERRVRTLRTTHPDALTGLSRSQLDDAMDASPGQPFVNSRRIADNAFLVLANRIVETQRQRIEDAWYRHAIATNDTHRDQMLHDGIEAILQPEQRLDVDGMLMRREALLIDAMNERRLAQVPLTVRHDWEAARERHAAVVGDISRDAPVAAIAPYTADALQRQLDTLGIATAATDIVIHLDHSADPFASRRDTPRPTQLSLVDLAARSIGRMDPARLSATDASGAVIPALDATTLRRIIRHVEPATSYPRYIAQAWTDGPDAASRRARSHDLWHATMRLQANDARLSYYLPGEPRSFRDDHSERGFRWIEAVLDAPSPKDRRKVEGHDVVVSQITYRGVPIKDVLLIGVRSSRSVPTVILYTPDTADGIAFREFDDRQSAGAAFLYNPSFREYLLDRLPAEFATTRPNGHARRFDTGRSRWITGTPDRADYTDTGEPFDERIVDVDFIDANRDAMVELALRNAAHLTRSNAQADAAALTPVLDLLADAANPAAVALRRSANLITHMPRNAWAFYDHAKARDAAAASQHLVDFYLGGLDLMTAGTLARTGVTRMASGVAHHPSVTMAHRVRLANKLSPPRPVSGSTASLDATYRAEGITVSSAPDRHGLYTINGRRYLKHDGTLYGARYDDAFDTVRLRRDNDSPFATGTAVRRVGPDQWTPHAVGLRGGTGRGVGVAQGPSGAQAPDIHDVYSAELVRTFPEVAERRFVVQQMQRELGQDLPAALSASQRTRWNQASNQAARLALVPQPSSRPIPRGFHVVSTDDMPTTLNFYDVRPFRDSHFQRERGNMGYYNRRAELIGEYIGHGVTGVRVTTLPPHAPTSSLRQVVGMPFLRSRAFGVSLRIRPLVEAGNRSTPRATLLRIDGTTDQYVLWSQGNGPIPIYRDEFTLIEDLPGAMPQLPVPPSAAAAD